jgi:hypothetical protein
MQATIAIAHESALASARDPRADQAATASAAPSRARLGAPRA